MSGDGYDYAMWFDHETGKPLRDVDMTREQLILAFRETLKLLNSAHQTMRDVRELRSMR